MSRSMSEDDVRALSSTAGLPLATDRVPAAAELLSAWVPAANELSRKMSSAEYLALMPIAVFTHPQTGENWE